MLNSAGQAVTDAGYTGLEVLFNDDDFADYLEAVKARLHQSPAVAGACIGAGLRTIPCASGRCARRRLLGAAHLVEFERLIQLVNEHSPKTKIFFNASIPTTVDAFKRNFPLSS